jgi:hypothetical protein
MKYRVLSISIVVALSLSVGLVGCGGDEMPQITQYSLTISSTEGGSVTTPGQGTGSFTYDEGEVVNIVAEPDEGYLFDEWTGDVDTIGNIDDATTTITMNGDYSITANFEEDEVVTFIDPNLEAAVREAIGKPTGSIYPSDLDGLTSLNATENNIADLTGLEYCTNLTELYLGNNQIDNISPLADLTNLIWLNLWDNQISDISPLANLTSLTELDFRDNQISDISLLVNLTNLTLLALTRNQISDISPLADLTSLTWLYISGNQITDISPLVNLINLTRLGLHGNQISDVSSLTDLTNLTRLGLTGNQISDISPLADFTSLTWLYLDSNQISDISPLVANPGLGDGDEVSLWDNPLSSDSINTYIPQLEASGVDVHY